MKKNLFYLIILYLFFFISSSFSEIVKDIKINGNFRIHADTIIDYGRIKKNYDYSSEDINNIQKLIFSSGFFKKITTKLSNQTLTIELIENPLIDFFNIQGESSDEVLNKIYDSLNLGSNKIYSEFFFKKDIDIIKDYYKKKGYLEIEVNPRVSELENNKLNILITLNKKEQTKINRIYFLGVTNFSNSELLNIITSSENGWWKFLTSTDVIDSERVEFDKFLLKKFFINEGYYNAQITSVEIKRINKSLANIVFSINLGKLFNFGQFKIDDPKSLINPKLVKEISLYKEKYFKKNYSPEKINNFIDKVNNLFKQNKFEFINTSILENLNNNSVDLVLKIDPIDKVYISNIVVTGNTITDENVIRRNLFFSEGDSYSDYKKNKSIDNLRATKIFKGAKIDSEIDKDNKAIININVSEQPTGSLSAGAGYGTQNGGEIMFGIKEENFLGKGLKFNTDIVFGTQQITGSISSAIPDFDNSGRTLFTNFYSTKNELSNTSYVLKKIGSDFATRYELYENTSFKPGFGLDFENVKYTSGASSYFNSQKGSYSTQRINYNIEYDERNRKIDTKEGYLLGFSQEVATLATDKPYFKNYFYASHFYPLLNKEVIKIDYGYSNISSLNNENIKVSDRLYLPGNFTKGFKPRGIGPKDISSGSYIGGDNMFYGALNVTIPNPMRETMKINTSGFLNVLNLWGVDNSSVPDSNYIRSAIGVNAEWRSPLGPLTFSLSKALKKTSTDQTQFFAFEIGTVF